MRLISAIVYLDSPGATGRQSGLVGSLQQPRTWILLTRSEGSALPLAPQSSSWNSSSCRVDLCLCCAGNRLSPSCLVPINVSYMDIYACGMRSQMSLNDGDLFGGKELLGRLVIEGTSQNVPLEANMDMTS